MEGEAGVLVGVPPALRRDAAGVLAGGGREGRDGGALDDGDAVAEDEVDGAGDAAVAVELAEGVRVERVLVALDGDAEEGGAIGVDAQRHRLVRRRPRRVPNRHVPCDEPRPRHRKRGAPEGGPAGGHAPAAGDDRLPHPLADDDDVRLLLPHLHVLLVHPSLHVDHVPPPAVARRPRHRLAHRPPPPAPVLRHHHVHAHRLPSRRRRPPSSARRRDLLLDIVDDVRHPWR
ncbi:Os01g0254350 [Oryza sativa Japonica Group]|uniref:Os01g0254350 protein n=1 Tax=Oryza sativa subsp. japonica TaxID=39947 RepID=A0A0P0V0W0_ORYSJ|nr:hypothetical protein EE612_001522 [Oryza sativa]BAS71379.1 Os01g0254350 [Oryza sativa Japonica Group]